MDPKPYKKTTPLEAGLPASAVVKCRDCPTLLTKPDGPHGPLVCSRCHANSRKAEAAAAIEAAFAAGEAAADARAAEVERAFTAGTSGDGPVVIIYEVRIVTLHGLRVDATYLNRNQADRHAEAVRARGMTARVVASVADPEK